MLDAASWGPQMRPIPKNVAWLCHSKSDMRGRELNSRVALNGVPNCALTTSVFPAVAGIQVFVGCRQKQIRSISVVPPHTLKQSLRAEVCLPDFHLGPTVVAHTLTRVSTCSVVLKHACRPGGPVPFAVIPRAWCCRAMLITNAPRQC